MNWVSVLAGLIPGLGALMLSYLALRAKSKTDSTIEEDSRRKELYADFAHLKADNEKCYKDLNDLREERLMLKEDALKAKRELGYAQADLVQSKALNDSLVAQLRDKEAVVKELYSKLERGRHEGT